MSGVIPMKDTLSKETSKWTQLCQTHQLVLDRITPFLYSRWLLWAALFICFAFRIFSAQGFYIIAYAYAIYILNLFIAFLSPMIDPAFEEMDELENEPGLPTSKADEFRPFMRRLPEFKFWYATIRATLVSLACTCFEVFNVPVFWPILVMYFIMLFYVTMQRQIKHMIRYRYIPFITGKPKYKGKEGTGKVIGAAAT